MMKNEEDFLAVLHSSKNRAITWREFVDAVSKVDTPVAPLAIRVSAKELDVAMAMAIPNLLRP